MPSPFAALAHRALFMTQAVAFAALLYVVALAWSVS
jgi:hypothetical protein